MRRRRKPRQTLPARIGGFYDVWTLKVRRENDIGGALALLFCRKRAVAVEDRGDGLIRHLSRQRPHQLDNIGVDAPSMLPRAILSHTQRRVIVASPPDDEIEAIVFHAHDDLFDQQANLDFPDPVRNRDWAVLALLLSRAADGRGLPSRARG